MQLTRNKIRAVLITLIAFLGSYAAVNLYRATHQHYVSLHWVAPQSGHQVFFYRVYRSTPNGAWQHVATVRTPEYVDKDVQPGQTYTYTTRAVTDEGESAPSNVTTATVPSN